MGKQLNPRAQAPLQHDGLSSLTSKEWIADIFEPLIDSIDVGVYVLDRSGVIVRVNTFILKQYAWEAEELIGQNIFLLLPDLTDIGMEENFREVIQKREIKELTNLHRKDRRGRDIVYNLKGIPIIESGKVKGVLVVMNDITEKWALESQMAETEEYLQSLIDNANDIIYTLDSEGHLTFLNKMGQEITGYQFSPEQRAHYTDYVVKKISRKMKNTSGKPSKASRDVMHPQS